METDDPSQPSHQQHQLTLNLHSNIIDAASAATYSVRTCLSNLLIHVNWIANLIFSIFLELKIH